MHEVDTEKLKAFKRIHAGDKLSDIVIDMGIPYTKLVGWRKELQTAQKNQTLHTLIDAPTVVVQTIAKRVQDDLANLIVEPTTPFEQYSPDLDTGTQVTQLAVIEGELQNAIKAVDGLQELNEQVQKTAFKLVNRVRHFSDLVSEPKEISLLVESLAKIQTAFFSRPGTLVQINNDNSNSPLGEFKQLMSD